MILELADELGTTIKQHKIMNDGEWRTKVTMKEWPNSNHIEPTNDHRKSFHQYLLESLCRGVSACGAVRDYKLSQPLGMISSSTNDSVCGIPQ